jgi:hypothetical protein
MDLDAQHMRLLLALLKRLAFPKRLVFLFPRDPHFLFPKGVLFPRDLACSTKETSILT